MKIIKNEKRTNLLNDTFESLLIAKVNGIDLEDSQTLKTLVDKYGPKLEEKKRKNPSLIQQPQPSEMKIESNSDNESITIQLKKVKLSEGKDPLETISNILHSHKFYPIIS